MNSRQQNLQKLKEDNASPNHDDFLDSFKKSIESSVAELKEAFGAGVELNNLDALLEQLASLKGLSEDISKLQEALKAISLPDSVKVEGLDSLIAKLAKVNSAPVQTLDTKPFTEVSKQLTKLVKKIDKLEAPKPGQKPEDFVPMRRVMKVGNKLLYDDSFYTGGGGGGSNIPTLPSSGQPAVPVVNPDGSYIGGSSGGLTDTQLRATPVPISGTVTTGGLTDIQLRATPVPISGTVTTTASAIRATDAYGIQAISKDATYKYFFFEDDSANYYVMRKHLTNATFTYTKGVGGYASVYQSSILGPSGSPTWADRGATF